MSIVLPSEWNAVFENQLVEEIELQGQIKTLQEGETFIDTGKNIRFFPIVMEGALKVTREDESGREVLLYYLNRNESCAMTFSCCMQTFPSEVTLTAIEKTTLLVIPTRKMEEWIVKFPSWKAFIMNTIRSRFNELLNALDQVVFQDLGQRLRSYLIERKKMTGSSILEISHSQIATDLATSREVISRLLKKMEKDDQLVLYRGKIEIKKAL